MENQWVRTICYEIRKNIDDRNHKRSYDENEVQSAQIVNSRMNTETPYQLYRKNANSFWADIPHHEARIKHKKNKMKLYVDITKRTFIEYKANGFNTKRKVQKWKKKASKIDHKSTKDHYSSLNLDEFNSYIDVVMKEICRSKITDQRQDLITGNKFQSREEKLTEKEFSSTNTPIPHIKCREETTFDSHVIPVCVMFKQKLNVIWCESYSTSLIDLKKKIKTKLGIPTDLQMLLHKGKVLNPRCPLRFTQYDTIHVLIKGKGGMQSSEIGISRSSSEKDVELWLKREVGLNEETFIKFCTLSELDGETLYSYSRDNVNALKSDTDIPIGIARKILAFRDKTYEGISNPLLEYTPEQISVFVQRSLCARDGSIERLCQNIVERHIDGFVFYNYTDEKEFQSDFHDLNIKGIYFRKVILKRNAEFKIPIQRDSSASEDMLAPVHALPFKPIQEEHSSSDSRSDFVRYPVQEAQSNKSDGHRYKEVLCSLLLLNKAQESDCVPCQFKIIYGSWTNKNELEKKFVFFLVCREDEFTEKSYQHGLWKQISNNMQKWLNLLPLDKKELFTETRQSGVYAFNRENIQLSKQCKLAFVMDKDCMSILEFDVPIILISKDIFQRGDNCFVTKLSRNPKAPELFYFSFKPSEKYFVFDPEDYSEGFERQIVCSTYNKEETNNQLTNVSAEIKLPLIQVSNTVKKEPDVDSHETEEENLCQALSLNAKEQNDKDTGIATTNERKTENKEINVQIPRDFKKQSDHVIYREGNIFSQPENDGTLSIRCIEFKSFFTCVNKSKENRLIKFQTETLRFACGCLNARKNGTIYFGVADSEQKIDGETYKHGEIVGFEISEIESDSRTKYTDALRDGISRCFYSDTVNIALKCISNPIFVKVAIPGEKMCRFVMEVDVEPLSIRCKNHHFKINLKNIKNITIKSVENKYMLYVRKGASTEHLVNEKEQLFIKTELQELVTERNNFDDQRKPESAFNTEDLATKLERLLTRGTFKFDKRVWPLLVLSKPNDEQKMNEKWTKSMSFIKRIQFTAVFDFDDFSNKNGLCCLHRNPERSAIYTERLFHENSGNLQELANKLGLPYDDKTLWIFANGRHDSLEDKPHLSRSGWHGCYSAGVCDAVSFFNQTFVIPKGRAVILVLLFSHDYDGVIDTFNEITRNFGWDPLVIVAEHKRTFDDFAETILKEGKGNKEDLEKVSVIGMPWEHVNSTVTSLTGYDEKLNCVLPCSSGAFIHAEERFVETLADLSILSATQCEHKEFKNIKTRRQFAREQELQFYKGQDVTWWNFYFENHVCSRNRYGTLQQKAQTFLSHAKEETRKVVTLIIAHEPGAGATTLGHQLLWHFRQKYRCCVIQKLSEMTIMHILSLWKYKEDEKSESPPKPIVLLLDEIVQTQLSLSEFTRQLNIEFRKSEFINGMNCLIIICQREEKLSDYGYESQNIFYLKQELSEKEKTWFTEKFEELERTGRELDLDEYKPQHLISFMIMRFEYNPEYIKNTIQHFISTIDQTSNEYKLLKYVSFLATYTPITRRGVKVFVPLECCDELMGCKQRFWEDHLSSPLKVLLIIEEKELASGRQVRIAHPSLGKVILCEIMNREKAHLADIAKEYLSCSLLQSISYGKKLLVDFTLEMLKRRKKEEYDDEKTTKFSPLIEEIKGDSANNYGEAAEILKIGFEKFNDYMLAQALARLYSEWKQYDEAIKWAKEAVDLSSKSSLSYILHTYGLVLREKFRHLTAKNTFYPERVREYLELILDSLDVFLRAQRERDDETDTQKLLYPFHDAIHTINEITKFLTENVIYVMDKKDLIRYLKEKDYIPDEICTVWSSFHARLKQMREQAHNAFKVLEDNVCFNTTFYAPEEVLRYTSQKMKEHRFYRSFHYGHEKMLEKFTSIYGEPDPPVDGATQAAKDSYHRGRLWTLKGNSYMNIFNHIKYSGIGLNLKDITNKLCEIKHHIAQIESKDSNDLANQVCVNVALGIVGSSKRDSESSIIKTCQQIISVGTEKVDLAYFFISMLLWPNDTMSQYYNDSLLQKSLSYLKRNFKQQKYKQPVQKSVHFYREEKNISQPTPQFFLAKGKGIKSLCHRWQVPVFVRENPDSQFDNSLWDHAKTEEKLKRLYGRITTSSDGSSTIIVFDNKHGEPIRISKIRGTNKGYDSEEEVSFYLGFSIAGPIAYNVKLKRHESFYMKRSRYQEESSKVDNYMKQPMKELRRSLIKIKELEEKRSDYLKKREKQLIKDKDDIREAIDRLEILSGKVDLSAYDEL